MMNSDEAAVASISGAPSATRGGDPAPHEERAGAGGDGPERKARADRREDADFAPAIFTLDAEGRFVRVGLRLARLLAVRREALVGVALASFIDPYDDEIFADRWFDLLAGGEALEMPTTLVLKGGERRRVRLDLLVRDPDDPEGGYAGVLTPEAGHQGETVPDFDVSKTLMDTFGIMVAVTDPNGVPLFSNAALRARFGRPLGAKGNGFTLVHPEDRASVVSEWIEAIAAGVPFTQEMRMAPPERPHFWVRVESRPHYDDRGAIRFWAATFIEIEEEIAAREALDDARRFIARLGEALPDVLFLYDLESHKNVYCSPASLPVLGYTPAEIQAMGPALLPTVIHPDDWPWVRELMYAGGSDAPDRGETIEYRCVKPDGEIVWLSARSVVFERHPDGRPRVNLGIAGDVTARKLVQIESEEHSRILEHALAGVSVLDAKGRYVYANAAYSEIAGRPVAELIGESWLLAVHPEDRVRMEDEYQRMLYEGRIETDCRGIRPDGTVFHEHVVMIPKWSDGRSSGDLEGCYRFSRDVTERVRFQAQLEDQLARISSMTAQLEGRTAELEHANGILAVQAGSDGLTGLANHRRFQETLAALIEAGRPHAVLLADVDHFKAYNDAFGHPAGDAVLTEFAGVLASLTGEGEIAARYGGEEFALILPDVDLEGAELRANLILDRLARTDWPHREITASLGCAAWHEGRTRADLVEAADRALYISKRNGRNRATAAA